MSQESSQQVIKQNSFEKFFMTKVESSPKTGFPDFEGQECTKKQSRFSNPPRFDPLTYS